MRRAVLSGLPIFCLWLVLPALAIGQPVSPVGYHRLGGVIAVGGAGDYTTTYDHTSQIFIDRGVPLAVVNIRWCRTSAPLESYLDYESQIAGAQRLAKYVIAYRAACPQEKIYLIGHSTGTHVALAAACMLPPNSLDRIALTAPMVSWNYDVRPALRSSRGGMDVWYSVEDEFAIMTTEHWGTADGKHMRGAGEFGFAVPPPQHPDACLFKNLRQHRWHDGYAGTGHHGGHFGFSRRGFLEAYALPWLIAPTTAP